MLDSLDATDDSWPNSDDFGFTIEDLEFHTGEALCHHIPHSAGWDYEGLKRFQVSTCSLFPLSTAFIEILSLGSNVSWNSKAVRNSLRARRILPEEDIERMFLNIDEIVLAHQTYLNAMRKLNSMGHLTVVERGWGKAFAQQV